MKVKRSEILMLNNALAQLDNTASDKETVAYKFSAKVMYSLYRNLTKVRQMVEDIEKIRIATVKKYIKEGEQAVSDKDMPKFSAEWHTFIEGEEEVSLEKVKLSELDLDKNSIPLYMLANLSIIIEDDTV